MNQSTYFYVKPIHGPKIKCQVSPADLQAQKGCPIFTTRIKCFDQKKTFQN